MSSATVSALFDGSYGPRRAAPWGRFPRAPLGERTPSTPAPLASYQPAERRSGQPIAAAAGDSVHTAGQSESGVQAEGGNREVAVECLQKVSSSCQPLHAERKLKLCVDSLNYSSSFSTARRIIHVALMCFFSWGCPKFPCSLSCCCALMLVSCTGGAQAGKVTHKWACFHALPQHSVFAVALYQKALHVTTAAQLLQQEQAPLGPGYMGVTDQDTRRLLLQTPLTIRMRKKFHIFNLFSMFIFLNQTNTVAGNELISYNAINQSFPCFKGDWQGNIIRWHI